MSVPKGRKIDFGLENALLAEIQEGRYKGVKTGLDMGIDPFFLSHVYKNKGEDRYHGESPLYRAVYQATSFSKPSDQSFKIFQLIIERLQAKGITLKNFEENITTVKIELGRSSGLYDSSAVLPPRYLFNIFTHIAEGLHKKDEPKRQAMSEAVLFSMIKYMVASGLDLDSNFIRVSSGEVYGNRMQDKEISLREFFKNNKEDMEMLYELMEKAKVTPEALAFSAAGKAAVSPETESAPQEDAPLPAAPGGPREEESPLPDAPGGPGTTKKTLG